MAFYGVGIDSEVARLICDIKLKLMNKYGCYGLRQLELSLRRAHQQNQGQPFSQEDFQELLGQIGVFVRLIDYQALAKYFSKSGNGVDLYEFVNRFRDPLPQKREDLIRAVFQKLDKNGNGLIEPSELAIYYRAIQNTDFVLGNKSEDEVVQHFIQQIDTNQDGRISYEEWRNYYIDISSMIGGDKAFHDLVTSCWGDQLQTKAMSLEEANSYINLIRERLVTMTKGVEDEFKLQKLFSGFDKHNSGMLSMFEFDGMLLKLNIVVPKDLMPLLFKHLDKNSSGYIEFDEFCNFLLYNPYKR